jgi:pyruvate dehydrogenase E2 component (dihydrolipoamide acetyltransferase)
MKDLQMPALGMAMTEGEILRWLRPAGEEVSEGEPLVEVETDKTTFVIESPAAGVLGSPMFEAGDVAPVGACLATIAEPADRVAGSAAGRTAEADETARTRHSLSPRQRRLQSEQMAAADTPPTGSVRLHRARSAMSAAVAESWRTIPHFCVTREIDAGPLLELREAGRRSVPELTVTDLLCRALGLALGAPPVSIGLAVDTPAGVMIPVLEDVVGIGLAELVAQRQAAVARANAGSTDQRELALRPEATLSNLGGYGVDLFTGIVPAGQSLLMAIGRIAPRVVAVDGAPTVRPTLFATLVGDHRQYDGAHMARIIGSFASAIPDVRALVEEQR